MFYERPPKGVTPQSAISRPAASVPTPLKRLVQWVLPSTCLECAEAVWEPRFSLGLCPRCRGRLVRYRSSAPRKARVISTWRYQDPLKSVITGLKFRRLDYLGEHLGKAMVEIHRREIGGCDVVVPVPLYWLRYLMRGYNQAALIARPIAERLGIPLVEALGRRRATAHQSRLGRNARQHNLERAFHVRRPAKIQGKRLLLVDDVTTTGATLAAAVTSLEEAGAACVLALTAAQTPDASGTSLPREA